jgi:hypothetical protein
MRQRRSEVQRKRARVAIVLSAEVQKNLGRQKDAALGELSAQDGNDTRCAK